MDLTSPLKYATVKDVARVAGVSVATVSRAYTPEAKVSDALRERVENAAAQLGYRPNPAAKALRLQRSFMVGAVFPTTYHGSYTRILEAFQSGMSAGGYMSVLLTVGFDSTKIFEPVRQLVDRGIEGLLVIGRIDDKRLVDFLLDRQIPVVNAFSVLKNWPFPSVGIDNYEATKMVMQHLLDLGHKEFAMISGPSVGNDRQQGRQKAFKDMLSRAGIKSEPRICEDFQSYTLHQSTKTFRKLILENPKLTAIVCNNDSSAMAALLEAQRLGIRVPEDLSITGFDDQEAAGILNPGLTTVSVEATKMGQSSAELLLESLNRTTTTAIPSMRLKASLVIRGSTAKARGRTALKLQSDF